MVAPGGGVWLFWGACMVAPGECVVAQGGVHGCSGGCAWLLGGACVVAPGGGMCGHSQWGMHGIRQDTEIRSMSGRYASY